MRGMIPLRSRWIPYLGKFDACRPIQNVRGWGDVLWFNGIWSGGGGIQVTRGIGDVPRNRVPF